MGYYIQTQGITGKAAAIAQRFNGQIVSMQTAREAMQDTAKGVVVVLHNPMFEAAGFAFDMDEFDSFTDSHDHRKKDFVVISREDAVRESGYNR